MGWIEEDESKPMTDQQIIDIAFKYKMFSLVDQIKFAREIEKHHGID
jgi:hypothetical protein